MEATRIWLKTYKVRLLSYLTKQWWYSRLAWIRKASKWCGVASICAYEFADILYGRSTENLLLLCFSLCINILLYVRDQIVCKWHVLLFSSCSLTSTSLSLWSILSGRGPLTLWALTRHVAAMGVCKIHEDADVRRLESFIEEFLHILAR